MEFTAKQVAQLINGVVEGDENVIINNVSKIEEGKPNTLTFLSNPKYEQYIYNTAASVVIINKDFELSKPVVPTLIRVDNAYQALAQLLDFYSQAQPKKTGIEQPSFISTSATLGDFTYVGAFAYIGENVKIGNNVQIHPQSYVGDNVTIGDNTVIYAGAKIYHNCRIGENCVLHSGSVIGADGFGFAPDANNNYKKIPQIGNVVLEDNVEVGSNTTIDRATMGSTFIRKGAKLHNLIMIGHNVEVGQNTVMAAQTGVAGSTKIGSNCMFGGQVGISGHITIASGVKIAAQSGIGVNITVPEAKLMGSPAFDAGSYNKSYVVYRKLPDLKRQLELLQKEVTELKASL